MKALLKGCKFHSTEGVKEVMTATLKVTRKGLQECFQQW
jgi:hypothetical protein